MGNLEQRDFIYFTYEEYDKMLDLMLYNIWKKTFIDKEDLKQDLIIFILRFEKRIQKYKEDRIDNIKGYIVHSLKMKTVNIMKDFFRKMKENNTLDLTEYEEIISSHFDTEDYVINKSYIRDLFDYYEVEKEDRLLLLGLRENNHRNERYLLQRWLRKRVQNFDKDKWKLDRSIDE